MDNKENKKEYAAENDAATYNTADDVNSINYKMARLLSIMETTEAHSKNAERHVRNIQRLLEICVYLMACIIISSILTGIGSAVAPELGVIILVISGVITIIIFFKQLSDYRRNR